MWWYDPDAANREECKYVREFRHLATEAILAHLSASTTPEQYQLALDALLALKDEQTGRMDAFHRSVLYARHRCIPDEYLSLRRHILTAMVLKPVPAGEPEPPQAPPTPPKPRSLSDVVNDFTSGTEEGSLPDGDKPDGE